MSSNELRYQIKAHESDFSEKEEEGMRGSADIKIPQILPIHSSDHDIDLSTRSYQISSSFPQKHEKKKSNHE